MKKKLKIMKVTAVILAVAFCTLLGCERKDREAGELILQLEETAVSEESAQNGDLSAVSTKTEAADGNPAAIYESGTVNPAGEPESRAEAEEAASAALESGTEEKTCVVHVCGAVKEPGVYIMDADARIYQAIEKAGGFDSDADENYLNQADMLSDGMKIYVPTSEEVEESGGEIAWKTSGETGASGEEAGKENQEKASEKGISPVNINTAGEAELCTLPGVGSNKAKSIIAYREKNGAYRTIEDIMNVEGIKDGVFQKIKDSITV